MPDLPPSHLHPQVSPASGQAPTANGAGASDPNAQRVRTAYYVLSSHWDREWHEPFEVFRRRLVTLLDNVLDAIEAGRLGGPFTCDGQSVVLEDYLAVRPERREAVCHALEHGQIVGGPWYVPPDELLVSGESLVRNLRLGRQVARDLGGVPSGVGFLGDLFGHNSQMPQIFKGFGIRGGFLWRGLNLTDERHVNWRGADGTVLPCFRFGTNGYWGFAVHVGGFTSADPAEKVGQGLADRLKDYLQDEADCTGIGPVLLFDGPDHRQFDDGLHQRLLEVFAEASRKQPWKFLPASLDQYQKQMLAEADRIKREVRGELLSPARYGLDEDQQWLTGGALASRVWIKQMNSAVQAWLCHAAEPWSAVVGRATGQADPPGLLDRAWRLLLKNHAHDSICGCSIDAVHEDVATRFRRSGQIAQTLAKDAWRRLACRADLPADDAHRRVLLVNTTPRPRLAVSEATVNIPADWPTAQRFNFDPEPIAHFDVIDEDGKPVPFQRLEQTLNQVHAERLAGRSPRRYRVHQVRIAIEAELPAMGYRTLRVVSLPSTKPMRGRSRKRGLMLDDRSMGNGRIEARFDSDGSFTLTDLATGQAYPRQLTFEDAGDVGDGWNFEAPANNATHSSATGRADLALVEDGPLQTTFRVRTFMELPSSFDRAKQHRGDDRRAMVIESFVTLRRGEDTVHIRTDIDHDHQDHRLRVLFPTDVAAEKYWADTPFDVVERAVGLPEDADEYREDPMETKPQQSWTATYVGSRGLAVVGAGLMESAVLDRRGKPIAMTLFRATRRTVFSNGEPGGQLKQKLSLRYALQPLGDGPKRAALSELGQRLNMESADTVEVSPTRCALDADAPRLPAAASLLELDGPTVLTSFREVNGAMEARLFNPEADTAEATLSFGPKVGDWSCPTSATPVDFESKPMGEPVQEDAGVFRLTLAPKQVLTVRFD